MNAPKAKPARTPGRPPAAPAAPQPPTAAGAMGPQRVLQLLVQGMTPDAAAAFLARSGTAPAEAAELVAAARRLMAEATPLTPEEQRGRALLRLEAVYTKAMATNDVKSAMAAQAEINRLTGLYAQPEEAEPPPDAAAASPDLAAVAGHLLPLRLAPADAPLQEHARLAAALITATRVQVLRSQAGASPPGEPDHGPRGPGDRAAAPGR